MSLIDEERYKGMRFWETPHLYFISNAEHVCNIGHAVVADLADMQQTACAIFKLQECSIELNGLNCADCNISNLQITWRE